MKEHKTTRLTSDWSTSTGRLKRLYAATRFAQPQRHAVAMIIGLMLGVAVLNAVEPLVLKWVIDGLLTPQGFNVLVLGVAMLAGFAILRELMDGTANWLTWRTRIGVQYALLEATIGKLHKMPLRMQRSQGIGALMTRLDRSIQGFTAAVTLLLFSVLPSVIFLTVAAVIMLQLDWRLAMVVLAFSPLPGLIAAVAGPEQTRRERSLLDRWAQIYARFNEVLSGIVIVRSFAMEDAEKSRFLRDVRKANKLVIRGVASDAGYASASNLIVALARLSAVGLGGWLVLQREMTLGTVVAFLGYVGGLFGPVQGLSSIYSSLRRASVSLDEIFGIIGVQEHLGDSPEATDIVDVKGTVSFANVQFHYEQADRPLLDGVSFRAEAGQTVAIVGPSGSGKTTLMALLMRFYDPIAGHIEIDGRDVRSIRQSSLRRKIGVVLQDPLLFNDTIRANIAYGRPDASNGEIEAAANAAHAHGFIRKLPNNYDTLVGERGAFLSVGERQRITIARALLKNPPILVLDEATAALDAESEEAVQAAILELMRYRTTFVIAHRLSTVIHSDHIIVLKEGRIVEEGKHSELMQRESYYASLVRRQQFGVIDGDGVQTGGAAQDDYMHAVAVPFWMA